MPDWSKMDLIPTAGLEAWYQIDTTSTAVLAPDFSGKGRHLTCGASNPPVFGTSPQNNELGYYFNGSRDPLAYTGSVTAKHVFTVIAFDKPAFTGYEGVMSGLTVGNILTSQNAGTTFFPFGPNSTGYIYRKNDAEFADVNEQAPMNGTFALVEQVLPGAGITMDGIQIGKQLVETPARLFNGWWLGAFIYSSLLGDIARLKLIMYHAMRFRVWPQTVSGLNVFPFPSARQRGRDLAVEHYLSDPYDGAQKALVRADVDSYQWIYPTRIQQEYEAAVAFWQQHRPISPFAMRDYRYTPYKDITSKFASSIREQGSDVTWRFNYSFETVNA